MIKECVAWCGRMVPTYQDEIDEWFNDTQSMSKVSFSPSDIEVIETGTKYFEDSAGLFGEDTVLINNAGEWSHEEVAKALSIYDSMIGDVRVGLIYSSGEPNKKIRGFITDLRERYISLDHEGLSEWIPSYLQKAGIKISDGDALKVAEHVGDDIDGLVLSLNSIMVTYENKRVRFDEIKPLLGGSRGVEIYEISKAILSGKKKLSMEMFEKITNRSDSNIIGLIALITKTFRDYAVLALDQNIDPEEIGIYGGRGYYIKKESSRISKGQAKLIVNQLYESDSQLFGGSNLEPYLVAMKLVINLTKIFAPSSR